MSITRLAPKASWKPWVTLNAPPNTPMSSPMRKTASSRTISSQRASLMASRNVTASPLSVFRRWSGLISATEVSDGGTSAMIDFPTPQNPVPKRSGGSRRACSASSRISSAARSSTSLSSTSWAQPLSKSFWRKRLIGSFAAHASISSGGT